MKKPSHIGPTKGGKKEEIEKGIIKVAWIEDKDNILYSKMFNSLAEAKKFTKQKKYSIVFKLIKRKNLEFEWEILDYGLAQDFLKMMELYREYGLEKGLSLFHKIKKKYKELIK